MKLSVLKYLRRFIALVVFVLSVLAFCGKFYGLKIFDTQLVALVQSALINTTLGVLIVLAVLLLITLVFGRVYCSTLCPLGILQELMMLLFKPLKKLLKMNQPIVQKHYTFAYFLAAVCFGGLLGGTVIIFRYFDPYSVFGNAAGLSIYGLVFVGVLALMVFFKNRFFCTNICPLGALLGWISRCSLFKIRLNPNMCVNCVKCMHKCPTGSIDLKTGKVDNETCIKCFNCLGSCNRGALTYSLKQEEDVAFNMGRREFLVKGGSFILLALAFRAGLTYTRSVGQKFKKAILPAGAGSVKDFANHCLNCNLCVENCPMKIIKKADKEFPVVHLDYKDSRCDYNCHKCSEVCPSGALKHLTLAQKRRTKLGTAVINTEVCVKCGLCVMECPRKVISKQAGKNPLIDAAACIGCGACQSACPVKAISIEPVNEQQIV